MNISRTIMAEYILDELQKIGLELDEEKHEALYDVLRYYSMDMLRYYDEKIVDVMNDPSLKEALFDEMMRKIGLEYFDERRDFYGRNYYNPSG